MDFIQTCKFLAAAKLGPREGVALGVIDKMDGQAQSRHVRNALGDLSENGSAVLFILRKKKLIEKVANPGGYPFWRISKTGFERLEKAREEALS